MKMRKLWIATLWIILGLFVYGCEEINTGDPVSAYLYWSGDSSLPKDLVVIHGKYWESPHITHEHILFLEIKAPLLWRKEFKELNQLKEVKKKSSKSEYFDWKDSEAPDWFNPPKYFKVFIPKNEYTRGSVYFENPVDGHMFLYDIHL
ncbi:hypothetical protein [Leptospira noguchii]|uniref:Uncharacterized protein n=3 Tax=Leptospira noguchii TaxID=28182 RepID=A0A9Q8RK10_9LEPT|nr:hypothetical protein [Leptospira noguchii]EMN00009.1 putative lipoprotein [Leptospira noguchii str. 2007001578]EMO39956.1 putative lipoprotein [Leptospira noguchii serovar Autumnalis str. ZUN142]EMS84810.1 putative lipoprotein [Leptospira noguchii str. Hook]EMS85747.1 putative lipoprotein [Leptospira noguchii str. Cascata]EPE86402.1 putative lipoprotein [Leptospira noguchii str. 1993005606]